MKQMMIKAFELKEKGYYKQAIEIFYKLLAKENDNIEILSELGCIYLLLNNYDRAIHYTQKALDIDSNHINSLMTLRDIYTKQKKYKEAGRIANKIYIITNSQTDLYQFLKLLNFQDNCLSSFPILQQFPLILWQNRIQADRQNTKLRLYYKN